MTSKKRLLSFLNYLKIGQAAFEKECTISNGYINNLKDSIGAKIVSKISTAYPELDTNWLITGDGYMLKIEVLKELYVCSVNKGKEIKLDTIEHLSEYPNIEIKNVVNKKFLSEWIESVNMFLNIIGEPDYKVINNKIDSALITYDFIIKDLPKKYSWLISGSVYKSEIEQIEDEDGVFIEEHNGSKFYKLSNGKYKIVAPLVPFYAYGRFINEADNIELGRDEWGTESFEVDSIVKGRYYAFEIKSDSMDNGNRDSFEEGDRILARELGKAHWDSIRYKKYPFWVIGFGNSLLIKQIINHNKEVAKITCHSLNNSPEYKDFELDLNSICRLCNVVQKKPKTVNY